MAGIGLEAFRDTYARMSDYDLADIYVLGPSAIVSAEVWRLVDEEVGRRGAGLTEEVELAANRRASEREAASQVAEVHQRTVSWPTRIVTAAFDVGILALPSVPIAFALGAELADGLGGALLLYLLVYQPISELLWQQSIAMREMGQRLVDIRGGKPSSGQIVTRALFRWGGGSGLLWYALWGTPWLHDGISRTRVVNHKGSVD